jgi:hypothetical protein
VAESVPVEGQAAFQVRDWEPDTVDLAKQATRWDWPGNSAVSFCETAWS